MTFKSNSQERCSSYTADNAIEPMVVGLRGALFPFVDNVTSCLRPHAVFAHEMIGEHPVLCRSRLEQRQTAFVADAVIGMSPRTDRRTHLPAQTAKDSD